ncbi:MAG: hypothetical protein LBC17_01460 [Lactobacillaceae bacterium]|jgi:beta-lactamase regulating signal transducer with metallopeptidase domain|nr:hypothetical protein [Lactobacillaceae bacterium]
MTNSNSKKTKSLKKKYAKSLVSKKEKTIIKPKLTADEIINLRSKQAIKRVEYTVDSHKKSKFEIFTIVISAIVVFIMVAAIIFSAFIY